jgi:hypothetical protein
VVAVRDLRARVALVQVAVPALECRPQAALRSSWPGVVVALPIIAYLAVAALVVGRQVLMEMQVAVVVDLVELNLLREPQV